LENKLRFILDGLTGLSRLILAVSRTHKQVSLLLLPLLAGQTQKAAAPSVTVLKRD